MVPIKISSKQVVEPEGIQPSLRLDPTLMVAFPYLYHHKALYAKYCYASYSYWCQCNLQVFCRWHYCQFPDYHWHEFVHASDLLQVWWHSYEAVDCNGYSGNTQIKGILHLLGHKLDSEIDLFVQLSFYRFSNKTQFNCEKDI